MKSSIVSRGLAILIVLICPSVFTSAQTWTQDGPPGRYYTSAIYDSATDQMVMFGGQGQTAPLNDLWSSPSIVGAGQTGTKTPYRWVQLFPIGTPPAARYGQGAVSDSVSNRMIHFGGSNCAAGYLSDVWVLSGANGESGTPTWTQLLPVGIGPSARENSSAIYDSANNVLTVFGGDAGGSGLSDVWTLSHANGQGGTPTWTQLLPTGTAPWARTGHSAVYDSLNNRMIVFGGNASLTGIRPLNDTWILTFANGIGGTPAWTSLKVTGSAPQRCFHTAFYSAADNDMIVFGGLSQINPLLGMTARSF